MRRLLFMPLAVALAASAAAQTDAPVRIDMRAVVDATRESVVLGDLAIIHTNDAETIRRLVDLPMGERPAAGAQTLVRREAIVRWVRSQLGLARGDVEWGGASETLVRTPEQEWHATRLEQVAQTAMAEWIAKNAPGYRAEAVPLAADVRLPAGKVAVSARPLPAGTDADRRVTVWLDVAVNGRVARSLPVEFVMTPPATASHAAAPVVARGDWVQLRMKSGGVELETRAQALQDGAAGQVVRVRASAADAPVAARVIAAGQVEGML